MSESLFYYFLVFNLSLVFVLACWIIVSDLRSRRELRKWEKPRAADSELTELRDHNTAAQHASSEARDENPSQETIEQTLDRVEQFRRELNQQVKDLEKER